MNESMCIGVTVFVLREMNERINLVQDNVPHPEVIDLIFHSGGLSAEEIVDRALAYRPIAL